MKTNAQPARLEGVAATGLVAADVMVPRTRTCSPFSTVTEAALIFKDEDSTMVPVVDEGKPVGVVTDRAIALAVANDPDLARHPVSGIMNRDVLTVPHETPVDRVVSLMAGAGTGSLLVVDADGFLVGAISWADLAARLPIVVDADGFLVGAISWADLAARLPIGVINAIVASEDHVEANPS